LVVLNDQHRLQKIFPGFNNDNNSMQVLAYCKYFNYEKKELIDSESLNRAWQVFGMKKQPSRSAMIYLAANVDI
jgi:hypothetical protein